MYPTSRRFVLKVKNSLQQSLRLVSETKDPVVHIKQGKLRGSVKKLYNGTEYYSFKGIPYAQPPIGDLRFKIAVPPKPWSGVYDAVEHGPVSPQVEVRTLAIEPSDESCLYLNVYTKSLQSDSKLPVMVYLHGGAYMYGSGNSSVYGPEFLLQHDVILVTLNYRLELLGFLCLDTPEMPGNIGMKDQVEALRWIQDNIAHFGGDPGSVTLFGESTGGCCASFHMFSPMSKGLFHKVIAQSGVCTTDWSIGLGARERAFRAGKVLGANTNDPKELMNFFKGLPASKLVALTHKTMTKDEEHRGLQIHFAPVVEKKFRNTEAFLEEDPIKLLLEGKINRVPMIGGYNSADGSTICKTHMKKIGFYSENPSFFVPREIALKVSEEKMKDIGQRIMKFYVGNRDFTSKDINEYTDMLTDVLITFTLHRFFHHYSKYCKSIYMYHFDCVTELNVFKELLGYGAYKGASHVDDLYYLFCNEQNVAAYEKHERLRKIVYNITKLWTNFARTGNPTPDNSLGVQWSPYAPDRKFLLIQEQLSMQTYSDKERAEFWDSLYKEGGCPGIPDKF